MNSLDLIILIPILIGFVFGLFKGLIKELTGLAAVILGFIAAIRFEAMVTPKLLSTFNLSASIAQALSYGIIFIVVAILLLIISNMLNKLISDISLGGLNSLFGGAFGALKYAIIISVLLNVYNLIDSELNLIKPETKQSSLSYRTMLNLGPQIWDGTKDFFDKTPDSTDNEQSKPNE